MLRKKTLSTRVMRTISLLLVAVIMLPSMVVFASDVYTSENKEANFVLVLDLSGTMSKNDPEEYGKDSIGMFVDKLPVECSSTGVIQFGHQNSSDRYKYASDFEPKTKSHMDYVQIVTPMTRMAEDGAETIKKAVKSLNGKGSETPIEAGLLAGVDMLTRAGAQNDRGCVVLLTDGDYKSNVTNSDQKDVQDSLQTAIDAIKAKGWYVYCIELDYAANEHNKTANNKFLTDSISRPCGNGETYQVESPADISSAFEQIMDNFYPTPGVGSEVPTDSQGLGEFTFEIPELTSESNITVSGYNLQGAQFLKDGEVVASFGENESYNTEDFELARGRYYWNIKMTLPEAGTWAVKVHAEANASVHAHCISFEDLLIRSTIDPASNKIDNPLTKGQFIKAQVEAVYGNRKIKKSSLGSARAYLCVENKETNKMIPPTELHWNDETSQFEGQIAIGDLGKSGELNVWTKLEYSGIVRESEHTVLYTYNEPVKPVNGAEINVTSPVRKQVMEDAGNLFINPDNDALNFELEYSSANVSEGDKAQISLSEDKKNVQIDTGKAVVDYTGNLYVWDDDMGRENAVQIPLSLSVTNNKMTTKRIRDIDMTDLLKDAGYSKEQLKEMGELSKTVNLNEYFADEDQEAINFSIECKDADALVRLTNDGGILTITALGTGKTEVTVSATDDDGTVYSETFKVNAADAQGLIDELNNRARAQMVRYIIYAAAALGIIALICLYAYVGRKIYGIWDIDFDGESETDIKLRSLGCCKSSKTLLSSIISELFGEDIEGGIQLHAGSRWTKTVIVTGLKDASEVYFKQIYTQDTKPVDKLVMKKGDTMDITIGGKNVVLTRKS